MCIKLLKKLKGKKHNNSYCYQPLMFQVNEDSRQQSLKLASNAYFDHRMTHSHFIFRMKKKTFFIRQKFAYCVTAVLVRLIT